MSSWTVVEFVDSKSVEAVPTKWLKSENQCFWPPITRAKVMVQIKNGQSPDSRWPLYKIRIFKDGTFDEYKTARLKAKKAEDTSDLNSDLDVCPMKRKIIRRKIFESDDSETGAEEECCGTTSIPTPPKLKLNNLATRSVPGKRTSSPKKFESQRLTLQETEKGSNSHSENIFETTQRNLEQQSTCIGCKELHNKIDMFISDTSKKMSSLKANMLQIREDIQTLIDRPHITASTSSETRKSEFLNLFDFPLASYEHLEEVNRYLNDNDENFENAVTHLAKLGGKDTYDFIRRCFQETLSDSLMRNFTYDGTKDKKSFKNLKLGMVILAASGLIGADRKQTEIAVRKWLRRANERYQSKFNKPNKDL